MSFSHDHSKILYLEASINYTWVVYSTGHKELKTSTLKKVHAALHSNKYLRIHRKFTVNREYIVESFPDKVILKDGTSLPISRRRKL